MFFTWPFFKPTSSPSLPAGPPMTLMYLIIDSITHSLSFSPENDKHWSCFAYNNKHRICSVSEKYISLGKKSILEKIACKLFLPINRNWTYNISGYNTRKLKPISNMHIHTWHRMIFCEQTTKRLVSNFLLIFSFTL